MQTDSTPYLPPLQEGIRSGITKVVTFKDFFQKATGNDPYPFQEEFASKPFVDLIKIPTGLGKTETAVLGWLWNLKKMEGIGRRLVYCLPMRTLVDQTEERVLSILSRLGMEKEIQVHVLRGGNISQSWIKSPESPMIIIGTQDQLLSRSLNRGYTVSKFQWSMHFSLLNNDCFWVIDEPQLMGPGLSTTIQLQKFRRDLGTFGGTHSVWMSATLSENSFATEWEVIPSLTSLTLPKTNPPTIERLLKAKKDLVEIPRARFSSSILENHKEGSITLVFVNTVERAQELFRSLEKKGVEIQLIHSRFRPGDRESKIRRILDEKFSGVIISTQVLEAGVDISADTLFTEAASWSSLVQRFGRCNRRGFQEGRVFWSPTQDPLPYTENEISFSTQTLMDLQEVSISTLNTISYSIPVSLPILRKKDLMELFDTSSSLDGFEVDISPFIRDSQDTNVFLAWRHWDGEKPPFENDFHDLELCSVPLDRRKIKEAWKWDDISSSWEKVSNFVPGMTLLMKAKLGGYSSRIGWTGDKKHIPEDVVIPSDPSPSFLEDPFSIQEKELSLETHSEDARIECEDLVKNLPLPDDIRDRVSCAAENHDIGKAHPVFQEMLKGKLSKTDPRQEEVWAKSTKEFSSYSPRKGFRHELASAIMFLQKYPERNLEAFLILCHHGKVRTSIRSKVFELEPPREEKFALGVWESDLVKWGGEEYNMETLSSLMSFGSSSWTSRLSILLNEFGPFRLSFLETLVRVSDWRASEKRAKG